MLICSRQKFEGGLRVLVSSLPGRFPLKSSELSRLEENRADAEIYSTDLLQTEGQREFLGWEKLGISRTVRKVSRREWQEQGGLWMEQKWGNGMSGDRVMWGVTSIDRVSGFILRWGAVIKLWPKCECCLLCGVRSLWLLGGKWPRGKRVRNRMIMCEAFQWSKCLDGYLDVVASERDMS